MIKELRMINWNNDIVVLHVRCKGKSTKFKKRMEKESKKVKLQKSYHRKRAWEVKPEKQSDEQLRTPQSEGLVPFGFYELRTYFSLVFVFQ